MRVFIIALTVLYWACASLAQSISVAPPDCPVVAETPPISELDVEARDLNPWRAVADEIKPVARVTVADAPRGSRVVARFRVDPQTGETKWRSDRLCGY